jgi:hypothetical protein
MPRPFLELTLDQFAEMLERFPWRRQVTEVHVHHTFRPDHADFASRPPIQSIEGMFRFHTEERGFADIAQHVTIDPRGSIWTGRNWNAAPASATGFNGNATAGPFMFEMIGNFDSGRDRWEGAQRDVAIAVIARVQKLFGLPPTAFRFHHDMSTKTCPGSAIRKDDVLEAVTAAHARLVTAPGVRAGAFGPAASPERATVESILRMFEVTPRAIAVPAAETELQEEEMTLRQMEASAGIRFAPRGPRATGDEDLTAEDLVLLRRHVINLRMGAFSAGGAFQTTAEDVVALFAEHLPAFLEARKAQDPQAKLKLVFFAHGGLNDEVESLKNARNRIPFYLANRCYPVFFVWETGVKETLRDILGQIIGLGAGREAAVTQAITNVTDPILEAQFRNAGFSMWANMKLSAERAFLPRQGGTFLVQQLAAFWKQHSTEMELHVIGHSAGAIFHAHFIDALCSQPSNPPITIESLHFLAPAITIALFKDTLMELVGGRVKSMTEYTMKREFEKADSVGPYRKSLLYLVSRSFEDEPEMPILGLEESLNQDPDLRDFFGLLNPKKRKAELLQSVLEEGPRRSTIAKKHGEFDNDRLTMGSVIRRILNVADHESIVEFPETVSRDVLSAPAIALAPPPAAGPALLLSPPLSIAGGLAPAVAITPVVPPGRRRALCIGIDAYEPPNRLAGCINDARAWAAALTELGFTTTLLLDGEATWEGILRATNDIVTTAQPGDVVVIQYAGHGTRVPDADGDEEGGRDSALCPFDFTSGRFIIDDDVRRMLQRLPPQVNLTGFFDCCHSGTITRLVAPGPSAPRGADVRGRGFFTTTEQKQAHKRFRAGRREAAPPPRGQLDMKEVSFAACTDAQTAQEIDGHGVFTTRALGILKLGLGTLTNADFHQRVMTAFGSTASEQTPQLDCAPSARSRPLLLPLTATGAVPTTVPDLAQVLARLADVERQLGALRQ